MASANDGKRWRDGGEYTVGEPVSIEYTRRVEREWQAAHAGQDALTVTAERIGVPVDFLRSLGVRSVPGSKSEVAYTWPESLGFMKIRNEAFTRDVATKNGNVSKFRWVAGKTPPTGVFPLWPHPEDGKEYPEMFFVEGETDCIVARYLGMPEAFTLGACTNVPDKRVLGKLRDHKVRTVFLLYDFDEYGGESVQKVVEALATVEGLTPIALDIGKVFVGRATQTEWSYKKDLGELFKLVGVDGCREMIENLKSDAITERNEDISMATVMDQAKTAQWVWEGLIPEGELVLLYGDPKCGKTTLTYQLMAAMERGSSLLDRDVDPQRVLYYSEMSPSLDKEKYERYILPHGRPKNLYTRDSHHPLMSGKSWAERVSILEQEIIRLGITYVVIDTVFEWMGFAENEENSSVAVKAKFAPLKRLCSKYGVTVQLISHPPKSGKGPTGAQAFGGDPSCLLYLTRDQGITTLKQDGRIQSGINELSFELVGNDYVLTASSHERARASRSVVDARVIQLLPLPPNFLRLNDLLEDSVLAAESCTSRSLRAVLNRLQREGIVESNRDGREYLYWRNFGYEVV